MKFLVLKYFTPRWRVYAEGTPQVIDCDSAISLPPEVRFSFSKESEFYFSARKQ